MSKTPILHQCFESTPITTYREAPNVKVNPPTGLTENNETYVWTKKAEK